jgi:hypothetical protein
MRNHFRVAFQIFHDLRNRISQPLFAQSLDLMGSNGMT